MASLRRSARALLMILAIPFGAVTLALFIAANHLSGD